MLRALAAGAAFVAAGVGGLVAALVASRPSLGLWVALGTVVVIGAVLQGAVTAGERRSSRRVGSFGVGAVSVGGNATEVRTRVRGRGRTAPADPAADGDAGDVTAYGDGSVSIGEGAGSVVTDVEGPAEQ